LFGGRLGELIEKSVKNIQLKKIQRSSEGKKRDSATAVVITDGVLKFHETDRRELYRERWLERLQKIISHV